MFLFGVFGVVLGVAATAAIGTTGAGEGTNFGEGGENPVSSELKSIVEKPEARSKDTAQEQIECSQKGRLRHYISIESWAGDGYRLLPAGLHMPFPCTCSKLPWG